LITTVETHSHSCFINYKKNEKNRTSTVVDEFWTAGVEHPAPKAKTTGGIL
jgi:hypothetical protein